MTATSGLAAQRRLGRGGLGSPGGRWLAGLGARLQPALQVLGLAVAGAGVLGLVLAIAAAETALPLSSDQALYSFVGRAIHHGAVPYRDFVDTKPPGIFYLRAALDVVTTSPTAWTAACAGNPVHASCGWLLVKGVDLATTAAFGLVLWLLASSIGFDRSAALAAAGLGMTYVSLSYVSQLGLTPEKLAALLAAVAVLLALWDSHTHLRWLLAGAAVAGAALMKQPAATALVPVMVLAAWDGEGRRRSGLAGSQAMLQHRLGALALVATGFVLPLVALGGVLAAQGALAEAVRYTLAINLERITTPGSLGGFGSDSAASTTWQAFKNGLAVYWLLGGTGALLAASSVVEARKRLGDSGYLVRWLALVAWVLVDLLLLVRLREYIQLAPGLAVLGGWSLARLWRAAGAPGHLGLHAGWLARAFLIAALASVWLLSNEYQVSVVGRVLNDRGIRSFVRSPDEFVADELGRLPAGPLFVWGSGTELYLLTNRPPAARSLNAITLSSNLPGAGTRRAELIAELARSRPAVIVVTPDADRADNGLGLASFSALSALLQAEYQSVDEVRRDAKYGGWQVFVRRDAGQG